jgi:hypothetical protein
VDGIGSWSCPVADFGINGTKPSCSAKTVLIFVSSSLLSNGYRGLPLGAKRSGREADHSPSSNAEVK